MTQFRRYQLDHLRAQRAPSRDNSKTPVPARTKSERTLTIPSQELIPGTSSYFSQLEDAPKPIVSGRAAKIPPIYKRPTASNISFEEGGVSNVSKSCSRQPHLLSATRGVRSRPSEEETSVSAKIETIPLLSPTMESELLREPWVFPQTKVDAVKEEDSTAFSAWEENFQDLSSWCMDTFQVPCDFHIGELTPFKLSGTKYEGNDVSTSDEGVLKELTSVTDRERWNLKMNPAETIEHTNGNSHSLLSISEPSNKYRKVHNNAEASMSDSRLRLTRGTTVPTNMTTWNKQNDTNLNTAFHIPEVDVHDACPSSFDSAETQREPWDILHTVEATGSSTFNLLSYVCDDDIHSPEGSLSTDSSTTSKLSSTVTSPSINMKNSIEIKVNKLTEPTRRRTETRSTSTLPSPSIETPVIPFRRSERTRTINTSRVEKSYTTTTRERQGRKRCYESEIDERSSDSHYKESREKNNEASRKSRMNKKAKENEMATKAIELERDNRILKMKVEELEKLVTSMRNALLRSALKKEF